MEKTAPNTANFPASMSAPASASSDKSTSSGPVVCSACRDAKVKCEFSHSSTVCNRCQRRGKCCVPTAPSQRGRCSSQARLSERNRARLIGDQPGPFQCLEADTSSSVDTEEMHTKDGNYVSTWLQVVHAVKTEILQDDSTYKPNTIHYLAMLCSKDIDEDVFTEMCEQHGCKREVVLQAAYTASLAPAINSLSEFPPQIYALVTSSSGYSMARCTTLRAQSHFTNKMFEAGLSTVEEMDHFVSTYTGSLGSEKFLLLYDFVHEDDMPRLNKYLIGMLLLKADVPGKVVQLETTDHVRVLDKRISAFVPCTVKTMIFFDPTYHTFFQGLDFTPAGPPEVNQCRRRSRRTNLLTELVSSLNISPASSPSASHTYPSSPSASHTYPGFGNQSPASDETLAEMLDDNQLGELCDLVFTDT